MTRPAISSCLGHVHHYVPRLSSVMSDLITQSLSRSSYFSQTFEVIFVSYVIVVFCTQQTCPNCQSLPFVMTLDTDSGVNVSSLALLVGCLSAPVIADSPQAMHHPNLNSLMCVLRVLFPGFYATDYARAVMFLVYITKNTEMYLSQLGG